MSLLVFHQVISASFSNITINIVPPFAPFPLQKLPHYYGFC
ncbi:MAG: hypothetical protein E6987_08010 [Peptoniphilus harei]|nr:hypothetical protein [Peptoniphilus harei]